MVVGGRRCVEALLCLQGQDMPPRGGSGGTDVHGGGWGPAGSAGWLDPASAAPYSWYVHTACGPGTDLHLVTASSVTV